MTCPHCGSTDWYELTDGRSRCEVCFATYETKREVESPKAEKTEAEEPKIMLTGKGPKP